MVSNAELSSKFESFSKNFGTFWKQFKEYKQKVGSMGATLEKAVSMESTLDEIKIALKNLTTSDKGKIFAETAPSQAVDHLNPSSTPATMQPHVASTSLL
ncbi:unnamed protein product [Dovyalis caffra]|uniref:Uncharacterized protein n=1 Tax=Dovyalis caffra TaxID=77055 RepID=A0AAV1SNJ5_9ROSI|nr:unnamed protein product [Dovyalis caffra]